jgi:hypothetical protein
MNDANNIPFTDNAQPRHIGPDGEFYIDPKDCASAWKHEMASWPDVDVEGPSDPPNLREMIEATIREWFYNNYEDPVYSLPRADGEWVYILGGPYSSGDILYDAFDDQLNMEEILEGLVDDLDSECGEWTPSHHRLFDRRDEG